MKFDLFSHLSHAVEVAEFEIAICIALIALALSLYMKSKLR